MATKTNASQEAKPKLPGYLVKQIQDIKDDEVLDKLFVSPQVPLYTTSTKYGSKRMKYVLQSNGQELTVERHLSPIERVHSITPTPTGMQRPTKRRHCLVVSGPGLEFPVLMSQTTCGKKSEGFECRIWWGNRYKFRKGPAEIRRVAADEPAQEVQAARSRGRPKGTRKRQASEGDMDYKDENIKLRFPNLPRQNRSSDQDDDNRRLNKRQKSDTGWRLNPFDILIGSKQSSVEVKAEEHQSSTLGTYPTANTMSGSARPETPIVNPAIKDIANSNIMVHFINDENSIVRSVPLSQCDTIGKFFLNATAAFDKFTDENWMLRVSDGEDEPEPLIKGSQRDFLRMIEKLKTRIQVKQEGNSDGSLGANREPVIEARIWELRDVD